MATVSHQLTLDPGSGVNKQNNRVEVAAGSAIELTGDAAFLIDDTKLSSKYDVQRALEALQRYFLRQGTSATDVGDLPTSGSLTL
ncbi:MAG: hypothetical protein GVY32_04145 [Gammaproteobacteria bacterium]|jgi:hypothetical protein|nr:hypothetical protein [Gammaproteobacteria bacterium]